MLPFAFSQNEKAKGNTVPVYKITRASTATAPFGWTRTGFKSISSICPWSAINAPTRSTTSASAPRSQAGAPRAQWTADTWELAPLQAATDALPALEQRFDAVVVDEGQDMASNDWDLVLALAGDGVLWAFADAAQSFWAEREVPAGVLPASFRLTRRYRCPEPLARFADLYRFQDEADPPGNNAAVLDAASPIDELRVVRVPTASAIPDKVAIEIQKALGGGAKPADIAVLTLAGQTRTQLGVADRIGSHEVVRADDARAADRVVADTFLRFKGLERPWIIVTEVYLGERRYDVRMHVALTRATVGCVVVATDEQIQRDPRLARSIG